MEVVFCFWMVDEEQGSTVFRQAKEQLAEQTEFFIHQSLHNS